MAETLGGIATWAYEAIDRPDLVGKAVAFAADVLTLVTERVPFDELRVKTAELPFTSGVDEYAIPSDCVGIISVRYSSASGAIRRLARKNVRMFDTLRPTPGVPYAYARFGGKIQAFPVPNSDSDTYRIRYWKQHPFNDATVFETFSKTPILTKASWNELYRWETLYRLLTHTQQHDLAMMLVMPSQIPRQPSPKFTRQFEVGIIPRLWNDLLMTVDQTEAIDEGWGISPSLRRFGS